MPGKSLDAELRKIKETGIAYENQECRQGINRVAVPVYDGKGRISGGVCASWFDAEFSEKAASQIAEKLKGITEFIREIK